MRLRNEKVESPTRYNQQQPVEKIKLKQLKSENWSFSKTTIVQKRKLVVV